MEVKWVLLLAFAGLGISFVSANRCGTDDVFACYNSLVHYEGLGFPLYGEDEQALDETCSSINDLFDCLDDYLKACNLKEDCDDKCKDIIKDIGLFSLNTGLRKLQGELCDPLSPMRLTYLDNYVCLEDNIEHYAKCQNDSQLSQEYLATVREHDEAIYARCCFFSWYEACFTNITRESCNENATLYVSLSLKYLMGHIVEQLCKDSEVVCSKPPMPPEVKPILTTEDVNNCTDGGCHSYTTETTHDETHEETHDEKDDKTNLDVDNCIDENCASSSHSIVFMFPLSSFILHCVMLLFSYACF